MKTTTTPGTKKLIEKSAAEIADQMFRHRTSKIVVRMASLLKLFSF